MRLRPYTAHRRPGAPPVVLREGWSWAAFLFGPLWLLVHRALWPALGLCVLLAACMLLAPGRAGTVGVVVLMVLSGLWGRDLVRWSLGRRGYALDAVLVARDEDAALARLLAYRPGMAAGLIALLR